MVMGVMAEVMMELSGLSRLAPLMRRSGGVRVLETAGAWQVVAA